jgi:hypothetical protein
MVVNTCKSIVSIKVSTPTYERVYTREILPEELIMSVSVRDIIGDGLAKISMSLEKSDKNYGNGVSVMASITLTVDQNEGAIAQAFSSVNFILQEELSKALDEARKLN